MQVNDERLHEIVRDLEEAINELDRFRAEIKSLQEPDLQRVDDALAVARSGFWLALIRASLLATPPHDISKECLPGPENDHLSGNMLDMTGEDWVKLFAANDRASRECFLRDVERGAP